MRTVLKATADPLWFAENILGVKLFPMQAWIMKEFYTGNNGLGYKKLISACGMRSGKSALAAIMNAYELFLLVTMPNPSAHWGLLPNQRISISCVATSTTQAEDSVFSNTTEFVENSEFFTRWTDIRIKEMTMYSKKKNVVMRVLSSWASSAVGRSNKAVVFDELANFEETAGKRGAWEVFSRLSKSTDTFKQDGKIIAISSLKHPNDIMMQLYKRGLKESNTLALKKPTWEMNPNFSKLDLMEEYKYDLTSFWRDYACEPQLVGSNQFPEGVIFNMDRTNVFDIFQDYETPIDSIQRVVSIDPAVTNDSFGIACGYLWGPTNKIIIDGVAKFQKTEGDIYIRPSDVRNFVMHGFKILNFYALVFDTWMYPELIELVDQELGYEVEKHITDKPTYDRWRERQELGSIDLTYDEYLDKELSNLLIINDKRVDHPRSGSKDVADAVANVIWYLGNKEGLDNEEEYIPRTPIASIRRYT